MGAGDGVDDGERLLDRRSGSGSAAHANMRFMQPQIALMHAPLQIRAVSQQQHLFRPPHLGPLVNPPTLSCRPASRCNGLRPGASSPEWGFVRPLLGRGSLGSPQRVALSPGEPPGASACRPKRDRFEVEGRPCGPGMMGGGPLIVVVGCFARHVARWRGQIVPRSTGSILIKKQLS